jgi:hypothetical protein
MAHLTGVKWNLSLVLTYISFMAKNVECCLAIRISSENCVFKSFAHLSVGLFVLLLFSFLNSFVYSGY